MLNGSPLGLHGGDDPGALTGMELSPDLYTECCCVHSTHSLSHTHTNTDERGQTHMYSGETMGGVAQYYCCFCWANRPGFDS